MTFQTDNTLITNREMLMELAAVAGRTLRAYGAAGLRSVGRMIRPT